MARLSIRMRTVSIPRASTSTIVRRQIQNRTHTITHERESSTARIGTATAMRMLTGTIRPLALTRSVAATAMATTTTATTTTATATTATTTKATTTMAATTMAATTIR